MVVSELRGEKIDIIPWNTEPARFVAKALSPARVREVYIDDETKEATVVVPNDQLALAIGKDGPERPPRRPPDRLEGRHPVRRGVRPGRGRGGVRGRGEGDGEGGDYSGRCAAILSNGKRCPNAALPGTRYCGVPAHQALVGQEPEEVVRPPRSRSTPSRVEIADARVEAEVELASRVAEAADEPLAADRQEDETPA